MSDAAAGVTYQYSISGGAATNQTEFAPVAATAMDVDTQGNVYMATSSGVEVYSSAGTLLMTVPVDLAHAQPARPGGADFGGATSGRCSSPPQAACTRWRSARRA